MEKGKKQISKKAKKKPEVIEEFGEVNEVTDDEIRELEDELKALPDVSVPPKQPENYGLKLEYAYENLVLLRNGEGVFYIVEPCLKSYDLKKLVVV